MDKVGEKLSGSEWGSSAVEICLAVRISMPRLRGEMVNLSPLQPRLSNRQVISSRLIASDRTVYKVGEELNYASRYGQRTSPSNLRAVTNAPASVQCSTSIQPLPLSQTERMWELLESGEKFHRDRVKKYESLIVSEQLLQSNKTSPTSLCPFITSQIISHEASAEMCKLVLTRERAAPITRKKEPVSDTTQKLLALEAGFHKNQGRIYELALSLEKPFSPQGVGIFESKTLQTSLKIALRETPGIIEAKELWETAMNFHNCQARKYESFLPSPNIAQQRERSHVSQQWAAYSLTPQAKRPLDQSSQFPWSNSPTASGKGAEEENRSSSRRKKRDLNLFDSE